MLEGRKMGDAKVRSVALVDQHPLWLDAVEPIVSGIGMQVVGKSSMPSEALELIETHRCDVLITGITMPPGEMNGLDLIAKARACVPEIKAIVLTSRDDTRQIDAALAAGAVAYVIKTAHADDLRSAIHQAFSHSIFLPRMRPAAAPTPAPATAADPAAELTRRELEILQLVAEGHSNSQLARMLWVTEQTVKFHLSNIYRKLDVVNRTEASRWAEVHGLLSGAGIPRLPLAERD
jgi:DNA-binding NarL/FixJ family response regulator